MLESDNYKIFKKATEAHIGPFDQWLSISSRQDIIDYCTKNFPFDKLPVASITIGSDSQQKFFKCVVQARLELGV